MSDFSPCHEHVSSGTAPGLGFDTKARDRGIGKGGRLQVHVANSLFLAMSKAAPSGYIKQHITQIYALMLLCCAKHRSHCPTEPRCDSRAQVRTPVPVALEGLRSYVCACVCAASSACPTPRAWVRLPPTSPLVSQDLSIIYSGARTPLLPESLVALKLRGKTSMTLHPYTSQMLLASRSSLNSQTAHLRRRATLCAPASACAQTESRRPTTCASAEHDVYLRIVLCYAIPRNS